MPLDSARGRRAFPLVRQLEQRVQMLGIFASHAVFPLEIKPAYSVGNLLLDASRCWSRRQREKDGVQQVLADHLAKVHKVSLALLA